MRLKEIRQCSVAGFCIFEEFLGRKKLADILVQFGICLTGAQVLTGVITEEAVGIVATSFQVRGQDCSAVQVRESKLWNGHAVINTDRDCKVGPVPSSCILRGQVSGHIVHASRISALAHK